MLWLGSTGNSGAYDNFFLVGVGGISIESYDAGFSGAADSVALDSSGLTDGEWVHCAMARSGSTTRVYIDGVERLSATGDNGDRVATSTICRFGANDWGEYHNAEISSAKLFERALTVAEVLSEMEQISPVSPSDGYWPLGAVGTQLDETGNGRSLTETGTSVVYDGGPGIPLRTSSLLAIPPSAAVSGATGTGTAIGLLGTGEGEGTQSQTGTASAVGLLGTGEGVGGQGEVGVGTAIGLIGTGSGVGTQEHSGTAAAIGLIGTASGVGGQEQIGTGTAIGLLGVGSGTGAQETGSAGAGAAVGLLGVGESVGTQTMEALATAIGLLGVGEGVGTQYTGPAVTTGVFTPSVSLLEGDEYFVVIDGPSTAAPSARIHITFRPTT
jgi:hypothetical protein